MGLRCSLLGHDYGESFVERDREERGNEVVVTERELQECARCGAEKVTSENTEVRVREPEPEPEQTPSADAESSTAEQSAEGAATEASESGGSGAFASASDAIEQAESGSSTADAGATTDADAGGEDAVILDDDADDEAPGSDQWDEPEDPEVDPTEAPEPTADPDDEDVEFVDAGSDGTTDAAEAETADAGGATGAQRAEPDQRDASADAGGAQAAATEPDSDRPRGEWPEPEGEDEGFDATDEADETAAFEFGDEEEEFVESDTGFTSAGPVETSATDDLDFELYCPECGFDRYAAGSSLRAGDICPECKRGYLAEDR